VKSDTLRAISLSLSVSRNQAYRPVVKLSCSQWYVSTAGNWSIVSYYPFARRELSLSRIVSYRIADPHSSSTLKNGLVLSLSLSSVAATPIH